METRIAAQEDFLLDNFKLQVRPGAKYVQDRRQAKVFSSVNSASPTGVNTIRWVISDDVSWLDPSSIMLSFVVNNTSGANPLKPATAGPHCLFSRVQLRLAGQSIEDLDQYNVICEALERCIPAGKRVSFGSYGFGQTLGTSQVFKAGSHTATVEEIPANGSRRVLMRIALSGLCNGNKFVPLWACRGGLEILCTLAQPVDALDTTAGKSQTYTLTELACHADLVTCDPMLDESYRQILQSGESLHLHLKTFNMTKMFIPQGNAGQFTLALSKSYSRVANIFSTFHQTFTDASKKDCNTFVMFPTARETIESHAVVGAKRIGDYPSQGAVEHYMNLQKALGINISLAHETNITMEDYLENSFVHGVELERLSNASSTGISTVGGSEISLHFKGYNNGADEVRRAVVALHHETIVSITASGILVEE
jgi:hypothetical protein